MAGPIFFDSQWVTIANTALLWIGAETISSMDDGSPGANFCAQLMPQAVKTVYSSYLWTQALRKTELAPMINTPSHFYKYQFALPQDFALLKSVESEGQYAVERRRILSDSKKLYITYVAIPSHPKDMSPALEDLVTRQLAYLLSTPMLKNSEISNRLSKEYMQSYALAVSQNSTGTYQEEVQLEPRWYDENR